jgi:beta-glucosidase
LRGTRKIAGLLIYVPFLLLTQSLAQSSAPPSDDAVMERRIDSLLAKLTLDEKIQLIGGDAGTYIYAEPKLGFPRLRLSDGPVGAHPDGPSTAYTAGIALAASWDPALAFSIGEALGNDARAQGVSYLLGPGVNIYRAPMCGRNFEYFGEDPYLASRTVVGYIEGVQSRGVVATVKHYALNNQEYSRHDVSSDADERTLREIYLPAFEAAVREARVGAVMDSYNLIDGEHATQNKWLNLEVLKKDWGFDGVLMSDWAATYDGVAAANAGLDLEMPNPDYMNRTTLLPAIRSGVVSMATIDDKVRRILRISLRFGFGDRPQLDLSIPRDNPESRAIALQEARESIILLKNEGTLLPLDLTKIHTLAVIGPAAWPANTGGGGSSYVTPFDAESILRGLSSLRGLKVLYSPGVIAVQDLYNDTKFDRPLDGAAEHDTVEIDTFSNRDFSGVPGSVSYAGNVANWRPNEWTAAVPEKQSIRYKATFTPQSTNAYIFATAAVASDSYRLLVDGKLLIQQPAHESQSPLWTELDLKKNVPIAVQLDYLPGADAPRISLGIRAVNDLISPNARVIAAQADAVLVAVGYDSSLESEGFDRTYKLPFAQDALIDTIATANKNTIVALVAGGEVDTRAWLGHVPAFLQLWYPGQEGGTAVAEILSGERSPEGKLPFTFVGSWEENPVHDHYYAAPVAPGVTPHIRYEEGVFLGYRYFTTNGKKPLYPFGFGLTYSDFRFSNLSISPDAGPVGNFHVSFDIANTGARPAADVAQLYIGDPSAKVKRPAKELKGFEKVRLDSGQSKHVDLIINKRALSYWNEQAHDWIVDPGVFKVYVGDSSENTQLTADLTVTAP